MVEAAAMIPVKSCGCIEFMSEKGCSTGSFDMVELKMAKAPMTHRTKKYGSVRFFLLFVSCIGIQQVTVWVSGILIFLLNAQN